MASPTSSGTCPRCATPLVEIHLGHADQSVVMRSCSTCDSRWWQRDGEAITLGSALVAVRSARKPGPRRNVAGAGSR